MGICKKICEKSIARLCSKIIVQNVKRIRQEEGLTQVDLIEKIEVQIDTTNISRIEKGRTNATIHILFRISQALDVPLYEICKLNKNTICQKVGI